MEINQYNIQTVISKLQLKFYNNDTYYLNESTNQWVNLSQQYPKDTDMAAALKGLIENELIYAGETDYTTAQLGNLYTRIKSAYLTQAYVSPESINQEQIVFTNGYVNEDGWFETTSIPFTPYQIPMAYNPKVAEHPLMKRFLDEIQTDNAQRKLMLKCLATGLTPKNWSVMPIFYSAHSTSGKGTMIELTQRIIGVKALGRVDGNKWLGKSSSNFALSNIISKTMVVMDELPEVMDANATDILKNYVDDKQFTLVEQKGIDAQQILNTQTFIATTNNPLNFYKTDDAIRQRIIYIPFDMNADGTSKFTYEEIKELKTAPAVEYLLHRMVVEFQDLLKTPGKRNERFELTTKNTDVWHSIESDSSVERALEMNKDFANNWDAKTTDYPFSYLKEIARLVIPNVGETSALQLFKKELTAYVAAKHLGTVIPYRTKVNGKEVKGLRITWTEENN